MTYDPSQREFSVELLSVDKWIKGDGLQAVFIPDFAQTALPLATQLRQAHPGVVLLGSNGWNDPAALGPAADDIDGAVFVDGFFASSQRRATQDFVAAYRAAYSATPEILEAQAYDAGQAGRSSRVQSGARSRSQVITALQSPRSFEGAAGTVGGRPAGHPAPALPAARRQRHDQRDRPPRRVRYRAARPPLPMAGQAAVR